MESIDDAINYEEEYNTYLQGAKNNGNSLIARCPFHKDDKPSFSVDLTSGKYHCFGCEEKGNLISFISKLENKDTQTVYLELCNKYDIDIKEIKDLQDLEIKKPFCPAAL